MRSFGGTGGRGEDRVDTLCLGSFARVLLVADAGNTLSRFIGLRIVTVDGRLGSSSRILGDNGGSCG